MLKLAYILFFIAAIFATLYSGNSSATASPSIICAVIGVFLVGVHFHINAKELSQGTLLILYLNKTLPIILPAVTYWVWWAFR